MSAKKILLVLVIIVLVAASVWAFFKFTEKKTLLTQNASKDFLPSGGDNSKVSTRDPNLTPDKTAQFRIEYGKIKDLLPYEKNSVKVQYDEALGFILARVKDVNNRSEFLAKKLTVEDLFKSKGVTDLCGLGITWLGPDGLTLETKDKLSPGCTL